MSRRLTISVFVAALFAVVGVGQEPKPQPPIGDPIPAPETAKKPADRKLGDKKVADPTDAAVAAALANDPDVKIAKAKVQLAEAELAKAKQVVVMKVMTLSAAVKEHQSAVEQHRERAAWADRMVKLGMMTPAQAQADRAKLESEQAALAKAETELKFLTGEPEAKAESGAVARLLYAQSIQRAYQDWERGQLREQQLLRDHYDRSHDAQTRAWEYFYLNRAVKGPVPERIRAALDKPIKLGKKGEQVRFDTALELFKKEAGFDVPVRTLPSPLPVIVSEGEELTVGAWLQLYQDTGHFVLYVREYGLLVATKATAPPDAPTLTEFWKQKPATEKQTAPEPKPAK